MAMVEKIINIKVVGIQEFDKATQSASALDVEIKQLANSNTLLKQKWQELIKNGAPTKELEKVSAEIAKNNARTNELRKSYNSALKEMNAVKGSMNALRMETSLMTQQANAFRVGVDGDEKALEKLKRQIQKNNAEIKKFDASMGNHQKNVGNYGASVKEALGAAGSSLGLTLGIGAVAAGLASIGKEAVATSLKAEGIERAFNKLNRPDLLDKLREATRGTVDDVTLMQRAVQANNFGQSLDTLNKMFSFTHQRARETGEDVNYLVESAVLGISRQSLMIIDNLGISAFAVRKELEKTGDFAVAVTNIMDQEMKKQGVIIDLNADKVGRISTSWDNFQKKVGDAIVNATTFVTDFVSLGTIWNRGVTDVINKGLDYSKTSYAKLQEMAAKGNLVAQGEITKRKKEFAATTKEAKATIETVASLRENLALWQKKADESGVGSEDRRIALGEVEKIEKKLALLDLSGASREKKHKEQEAELRRHVEETKKLQDQLVNIQIENDTDNTNKELKKETIRYNNRMNELKKYNAKNKEEQTLYSQLIEEETKKHNSNIASIEKKAADDIIKMKDAKRKEEQDKIIKNFTDKMKLKQTQFNLELDDLMRQKKRGEISEKQFAETQYKKQKEFALNQINEINSLLNPQTADNSGSVVLPDIPEDKKNELLTKIKELYGQIETIETEHTEASKEIWKKKFDNIAENVQNVMGLLDQAFQVSFSNQSKDLERNKANEDKALEDAKERELSRTNISSAEKKRIEDKYNKQKAASDAKYADEKEKIDRKQFNLNKIKSIAEVAINTARAVAGVTAEALLAAPFFIPGVIAMGAAQIGIIAAQKFERGGVLRGASHAAGGVKYYSPHGNVELEGGELVINKNIHSRPDWVAAISEMNAQTGGVRFASGGQIPAFSPPRSTSFTQSFSSNSKLAIDYNILAQTISEAMASKLNNVRYIAAYDTRDIEKNLTSNAQARRNGRLG